MLRMAIAARVFAASSVASLTAGLATHAVALPVAVPVAPAAVARVAAAGAQAPVPTDATVLRVQMLGEVETLDPARAPELGTVNSIAPLYHQLLTYDYGARPVRLIPYAAAALPQLSADRRTYTLKLRPGLLFAPHPAFGGKPRELVAEDFVYSWKRIADPAHSSMSWSALEGLIEGMDDAVGRARREAKPFDYAATVAGLRATDRYTLEIRLTRPDPTFIYQLAYGGLSAVPREVVEAEGAEFSRKAIGSGPYQVARFQPGTRLDVVRNPNFRPLPWEFFAPNAPADSALAKAMRGRTVPLADRVEMLRIPEPSTAVLSLTRGEIDVIAYARAALVFDGTTLKAPLRDAGIRAERAPDQGMYLLQFNMRDPLIGGFAPAQVALRRAISMAIDDAAWLRTFDQGVGTVRQHIIGPDTVGHDPAYRNPNAYNPATANALLDRMGYARGADGWRRRPDGSPLELRMINGTSTESRRLAEFMKRSLDAISIRVSFDSMPGGDRLKRLSTCQFQLTTMSFGGGAPDGTSAMANFHSPNIGTVNFSCYRSDEFDRTYERLRVMPAGPERTPVFAELTALLDAHAPARILPSADDVTLLAPRVRGFAVNPYLPLPYYLFDVAAVAR
jgi:oligopeptide transport system substrate-binding protein